MDSGDEAMAGVTGGGMVRFAQWMMYQSISHGSGPGGGYNMRRGRLLCKPV